jgi:NADPH:quinone reductase-like Zn-dependent oxidoreductase
MRALIRTRYGGPEVVRLVERPEPEPRAGELLIEVEASAVTAADWRLRAGAFGGITALPGRLMFGVLRPRSERLGTAFAGRVLRGGATLPEGAAVYGIHPWGGASADRLAMPAGGAVAAMPPGLTAVEAAALPYGALTAHDVMTRTAPVRPGQAVLIGGASGGVGGYAVQIARALGATVSALGSGASLDALTELGAREALDYAATSLASLGPRFDFVLDASGAIAAAQGLALLRPGGRFVPLDLDAAKIAAALRTRRADRRLMLTVARDGSPGLDALSRLVTQGRLAPRVAAVLPLEQAARAHALVEGRHARGTVVLDHRAAGR